MAQLKDLIVNGPSRFIGDVYATTFTGNLAGNANTATSATNAGMIAGLSVHSGRNNEANKIVRTDGNGYLQVGYINSSSGHEKNASNPTYVWGSNSSDSYLRSYQTSSLSVNYANSSGACTGNAATATNADQVDNMHANDLHNWVLGTNMTYTASTRTFTNTRTTNDWATQFYSHTCFKNNCYISFRGVGTGNYRMVGLNSDPTTNANYTSIDYCWYLQSNRSLTIYENGSNIGSISGHTTYADGDEFRIEYSGGNVRYYHNGALCRTVARAIGSPLYADCSFYNGGSIRDVEFGSIPYYVLNSNYATTSGSCSGNAATATNASSAGNADKLDGVHYQNILERQASGNFEGKAVTGTGWFRIAETLVTDNDAPTFLLAIQRNYLDTENESYLFSISVSFGGGISITQLSGYANRRLITKIRVDWDYVQKAYVDLYINSSYINKYYWYTIGCAKSYTTWTANPTLMGEAHEFTTVQGCKSDKGFTGYLTGTASSSSKWTYARTITLTGSVTGSVSIDGSQNVSLATTTNHTHTFASLTDKPTTLSGYGITDALPLNGGILNVNKSIGFRPNSAVSGGGGWALDCINFYDRAATKRFGRLGYYGDNLNLNCIYLGTGEYSDVNLRIYGKGQNDLKWGNNVVLHAGNYNSYAPKLDGTGASGTWGINISGNADTLDGYHASQVLTANSLGNGADLNKISEPSIHRLSTQNPNLPSSMFNYGNLLTIKYPTSDTAWQLLGSYSSDALWFRRGTWYADGTGTLSTNAWKVIAFIDSNVASATKLQNSRTIWGQSFDGTGNVSGGMGDVTYIEMSYTTPFIDFHYNYSTADFTSRIIEGLSGQLTVTGKLRVGLNYTTSTDYAFHVVGAGYFTENVITESDFISRGDAIIDGNVGIGTQRPDYNLDVYGNMRITGPIWLDVLNSNGKYFISTEDNGLLGITYDGRDQNPAFLMNSLGYVYLNCETTESPTYPLVVNGTIQCTKLLQTSDIKYKTNIKQIEYEEALKIIENLNPVTWDWNENTVETGSSSGFVAQEAEEFIPNAISRDNKNNLSLDYTQLHSYEIKVIQEQQKEIIKLKEKLKILEKLIS